MTLSLTTSLSSTITKSELESNFTDIQNKFSAGIDNSDIKSGAGIDISKLTAQKEYVVVTLETRGEAAGLAVDDEYRDYTSLPGITGNQSAWTLVAASWVCTDVGDGSTVPTFDVEWLHWDSDAGTNTVATTVIADEPLSKGSDSELNAKQCNVDSTSFSYHGSKTGVFALKITNPYTDALTDDDDPSAPKFLKVSLLLERDIQA